MGRSEVVKPPEALRVRRESAPAPHFRWRFSPGREELGESLAGIDWLQIDQDPRAERVKRNPLRDVYRISISGCGCYAKVFHERGPLGAAKCLLLGSAAGREFQSARALADLGVPAIRAIAAGHCPIPRMSVLVSEAAEGAASLASAWRDVPGRPALIRAVAEFLADAHARGAIVRDLHAANLLVRRVQSAAGFELLLVDLAGVRIGRAPARAEVVRALSELVQWFWPRSSRIQRLRFLRSYVERRWPGGGADLAAWARAVESAARRQRARLWNERDRRITGDNAYFARVRLPGGWRGHLCLRSRRGTLPDALTSRDRVKNEAVEWLSALIPPDDGLLSAMARSGAPPGIPEDSGVQVVQISANADPTAAFITAHRLRHRDLPVCAAVAALQRRTGRKRIGLWFEQRPAGLTPFADALRAARARRSGLNALLRAAGTAAGQLIERGVLPGGWSEQNFNVLADGTVILKPDEKWHIRRRISDAQAYWALARLTDSVPAGVSRSDRLRFLRGVLAGRRLGPWKSVWKMVEAMTERSP